MDRAAAFSSFRTESHLAPTLSSLPPTLIRRRSVTMLSTASTYSDVSDYSSDGSDDSTEARRICPLPNRKERFIHLNGRPYFYYKDLRLMTDGDLYNPDIRRDILRIGRSELATLHARRILVPSDWEMWVLSAKKEPGKWSSGFISFSRRVSFKILRNGNISQCSKSHFWHILETFPMHRESLPIWAEADFLGALTHGASERVLNYKDTTYPFTDVQTKRFIQIYKDLQDRRVQEDVPSIIPALIWHIARIMHEIEKSRESYGYGKYHEFRIYRNVAHPEPSWKVHFLDAALVFVLLGGHTAYRKRLLSTRVKGKVYVPDFQNLMQSLLEEWADTNLLATVFVSANVAFLAIPTTTGLQRTASLASSLFAMMSIVTGVHHVWQHRGKTDVEFEEAHKYLHHVDYVGQEMDLTITACFLSLPLVSLLWSVLSFTVAVGAFCFQESSVRGEILLAVVLGLGGILALCVLLFFWHIWRSPPTREIEEDYHLNAALNVDPLTWQETAKKRMRELLGRRKEETQDTEDNESAYNVCSGKRPRRE